MLPAERNKNERKMGIEFLEEGNLKGFTDTRSQLRRTIDRF